MRLVPCSLLLFNLVFAKPKPNSQSNTAPVTFNCGFSCPKSPVGDSKECVITCKMNKFITVPYRMTGINLIDQIPLIHSVKDAYDDKILREKVIAQPTEAVTQPIKAEDDLKINRGNNIVNKINYKCHTRCPILGYNLGNICIVQCTANNEPVPFSDDFGVNIKPKPGYAYKDKVSNKFLFDTESIVDPPKLNDNKATNNKCYTSCPMTKVGMSHNCFIKCLSNGKQVPYTEDLGVKIRAKDGFSYRDAVTNEFLFGSQNNFEKNKESIKNRESNSQKIYNKCNTSCKQNQVGQVSSCQISCMSNGKTVPYSKDLGITFKKIYDNVVYVDKLTGENIDFRMESDDDLKVGKQEVVQPDDDDVVVVLKEDKPTFEQARPDSTELKDSSSVEKTIYTKYVCNANCPYSRNIKSNNCGITCTANGVPIPYSESKVRMVEASNDQSLTFVDTVAKIVIQGEQVDLEEVVPFDHTRN